MSSEGGAVLREFVEGMMHFTSDKTSTAECFKRGGVYFIKGEPNLSVLFLKNDQQLMLKSKFYISESKERH